MSEHPKEDQLRALRERRFGKAYGKSRLAKVEIVPGQNASRDIPASRDIASENEALRAEVASLKRLLAKANARPEPVTVEPSSGGCSVCAARRAAEAAKKRKQRKARDGQGRGK